MYRYYYKISNISRSIYLVEVLKIKIISIGINLVCKVKGDDQGYRCDQRQNLPKSNSTEKDHN